MSEQIKISSEVPKFSVEAIDVLRDESLKKRYYEERVEAITKGLPVWLVRTFKVSSGMERGYAHDYYQDRQWQGFIDGNEAEGFLVYRKPTDQEVETDGPQSKLLNVNDMCETLGQAKKMLGDYVRETSL